MGEQGRMEHTPVRSKGHCSPLYMQSKASTRRTWTSQEKLYCSSWDVFRRMLCGTNKHQNPPWNAMIYHHFPIVSPWKPPEMGFHYPLVNVYSLLLKMAIYIELIYPWKMVDLSIVFPLKMVIFHSYVNIYQRGPHFQTHSDAAVSPWSTMVNVVFPWK